MVEVVKRQNDVDANFSKEVKVSQFPVVSLSSCVKIGVAGNTKIEKTSKQCVTCHRKRLSGFR